MWIKINVVLIVCFWYSHRYHVGNSSRWRVQIKNVLVCNLVLYNRPRFLNRHLLWVLDLLFSPCSLKRLFFVLAGIAALLIWSGSKKTGAGLSVNVAQIDSRVALDCDAYWCIVQCFLALSLTLPLNIISDQQANLWTMGIHDQTEPKPHLDRVFLHNGLFNDIIFSSDICSPNP